MAYNYMAKWIPALKSSWSREATKCLLGITANSEPLAASKICTRKQLSLELLLDDANVPRFVHVFATMSPLQCSQILLQKSLKPKPPNSSSCAISDILRFRTRWRKTYC